jgi:hypothetical protein
MHGANACHKGNTTHKRTNTQKRIKTKEMLQKHAKKFKGTNQTMVFKKTMATKRDERRGAPQQ